MNKKPNFEYILTFSQEDNVFCFSMKFSIKVNSLNSSVFFKIRFNSCFNKNNWGSLSNKVLLLLLVNSSLFYDI